MQENKSNSKKPVIYLNHWDYNKHELVKIWSKGVNKGICHILENSPWIRYSKQFKCFYFIKSKNNLDLFYNIFTNHVEINDWYLNRKKTNITIKKATATNDKYETKIQLVKKNKKPQVWLIPIADNNYPKHILLKYKFNKDIYSALKNIIKVEWSKNHNSFVMERNISTINEVIKQLQDTAKISISKELEIKNAETLKLLLEQSFDTEKLTSCPDSYMNKLVALN